MRALLSLVVGTLMLNMSVHAGSSTRTSNTDAPEDQDEDLEDEENPIAWKQPAIEDLSGAVCGPST